jgi:hypothetical protein
MKIVPELCLIRTTSISSFGKVVNTAIAPMTILLLVPKPHASPMNKTQGSRIAVEATLPMLCSKQSLV